MSLRFRTICPFVIAILLTTTLTAQHGDHGAMPAAMDTIPLYTEALGEFSRTISTRNELAQAYFDQGMQLKYAFGVKEAAQSFREAQKLDP